MKYTLTVAFFFINSMACAAVNSDQKLFDELAKKDAVLFEKVFNNCEIEYLDGVIHDDFEFYHDKSGVQDRAGFVESIEKYVCGSSQQKVIRKLAAGSLNVFRMSNNGETYGALQSGEHDFYIQEPEKEKYKTGFAKFTHLWVRADGEWKLKRVLSFDHQTPSLRYPSVEFERGVDAGYRPRLFGEEVTIQGLLKQHKIPSIALGLIGNGQLQQIRVFSANNDAPMHGLYNVASLTKPVVALVVLKLVNDDRWSLDDSLSEYYVDADVSEHPMLDKLTTRHVLSHQSGFPNWRYQAKDNKLTFNFKPGSEYQYSGEGFEYLRKAVEAKFGKSFEEIAKSELFEPLGMNDTHFYWNDRVEQDRYQQEHDAKGNAIELKKHTTANGADDLITSVEDFSTFMVHLLKGADLRPELRQEMAAVQVAIKSEVGFGLGWQRFDNLQAQDDPNEEYALQHTGSDSGTNALAIMLPNSQRGIVLLSNSDNAKKLWTKIVSEYFGEVGNNLLMANFR